MTLPQQTRVTLKRTTRALCAVVANAVVFFSLFSVDAVDAAQLCAVTLSANSTAAIGGLQIAISYGAAGGEFVGSGTQVDCTDLSGAGIKTFDDDDDAKVLLGSWVDLEGLWGPLSLMRCSFQADAGVPEEADFVVDVRDAVDVALEPISVAAFISGISCAMVIEGCGDISGDGAISATDALVALQRGVGLDAPANCIDNCSTTSTTTMTSTTTTTMVGTAYTLQVAKGGTGKGRVISSPSGINCGSDCSQLFNKGVKVTLSATADSGSEFAGWSGNVPSACQGSMAPCTFTMSANRTVTASFDAIAVTCPTAGPITDLRNDCSDYGYFYSLPGLAEGLVTDGASVVVAQSDGIDVLGYSGPVTGQTTFTLTHVSVNGGPFYAVLESGSRGSISADGHTLNLTIKVGGETFTFNGASWIETRPLLTVGGLNGSVLRMLGAAALQFPAARVATGESDWCADVSGDGSISATDALMILNRGIGLDVPLNCDDPCG